MATIPLTQLGPDDGGNYEFHWSNGGLEAHFISDVGRKRQHNEDSCAICAPEDETLADERGLLFAVADGMGGASAGEFASRLALTILTEELYKDGPQSVPERLRESIERANERVFDEASRNPAYEGMGTTMCSLLIKQGYAYIGHVGDSRLYLVRGSDDLVQLTDDHSLVAEQLRSGLISEEEAKTHALKNLITRAIGIKEQVEVDVMGIQLKKGDTYLICSDGLSNMVESEDIAHTLKMDSLQGAARVLVGKALEAGGTDNISAVLIRVAEDQPKTSIDSGCLEITVAETGFWAALKRFFLGE